MLEKCNTGKERHRLSKAGPDKPTLWKSQLDALNQHLIPPEPQDFILRDTKPPIDSNVNATAASSMRTWRTTAQALQRGLPELGVPRCTHCVRGDAQEGDPSTGNHLNPITAHSCPRNRWEISPVRHGTLRRRVPPRLPPVRDQNPSDRGDVASAKHMVATHSNREAKVLLAPRATQIA